MKTSKIFDVLKEGDYVILSIDGDRDSVAMFSRKVEGREDMVYVSYGKMELLIDICDVTVPPSTESKYAKKLELESKMATHRLNAEARKEALSDAHRRNEEKKANDRLYRKLVAAEEAVTVAETEMTVHAYRNALALVQDLQAE